MNVFVRLTFGTLRDLEFDHLLFAHGMPWLGGGKAALRAFVESEVEA